LRQQSKLILQENEELLNERNQLLQMCEELEIQVKESHRSLEESLEKIIILEKDIQIKD
jgi:hypothetical protein